MKIKNCVLEGGGACPEQYDVYLNGIEIGYLRLRHGCFTVSYTYKSSIDNVIWVDYPNGDGIFDSEERYKYLKKAIKKLKKVYEKDNNS